jgi:DNA-binding NtrC family response regulator
VEKPVTLVIIDDSPSSLELLSSALAQEGLDILTAQDADEGLDLIYERHPQIVLTDLVMPGMDGLEVLDRVIDFDPVTEVILMTAHYTTESAVEAIRKGASDYLNKPLPIAMLRKRIGRVVQEARRRQKSIDLADALLAGCEFEGIVGNSPVMWDLSSRIRKIAPHYRTALVTGATGSGKNLVARAIHRLSPARLEGFVTLDCTAAGESLFENELPGLIERADGGTLFLDEIGYTPLGAQAVLMRALQDPETKSDVRVIVSTQRNLQAAMAERQFREDLYYRLAMVEVALPLLAERAEDLPLLERSFVVRFAERFAKTILGLTPRAQIMLARHTWPGNVRELENVIGHACMMVMGDTIDVRDLPEYLWDGGTAGEDGEVPALAPPPAGLLEDQERRLIMKALETTGGNQSKAARLLRIGRDALRYKAKKYGL